MTTVAWMVYALAISVLVAAGARLLEQGLASLGVPTRWVWLGGLLLCIALPVLALADPPTPASSSGVLVSLDETPVPASSTDAAAPRGGPVEGILARIWSWRRSLDRGLAAVTERLGVGAGLGGWIVGTWVGSSVLIVLLLVGSGARLSRRLEGWPREIHRGREVRVSPELGPATCGLLRPRIVIPRWATRLPGPELELVLAHEEEHGRAKDPLALGFGLVAVVMWPWNPLIWWQHRRLRDAVEVDCDRRVIRAGAAASSYGDLLLKMGTQPRRGVLPVPTMTGSRSLLERRLTTMRDLKLRAALPGALASSFVALMLLVVACSTEPSMATGGAAAVDARTSVLERNELVADIWVEPDGSVYVNDEPSDMADVSDVLGRLRAAAPGELVVSIAADPVVPYRVMAELQREIQGAEVQRVVFGVDASRPPPTPPGDPADVTDGLGVVLPADLQGVRVAQRNVLGMVVQPSGVVEVSRAGDGAVRQIRPEALTALWRKEVAANANLIAAVKTHPEAAYSSMMQVLDALHAADARRISIQTLE